MAARRPKRPWRDSGVVAFGNETAVLAASVLSREHGAGLETSGQQSTRAVEQWLSRASHDDFTIERDLARVAVAVPCHVTGYHQPHNPTRLGRRKHARAVGVGLNGAGRAQHALGAAGR